MSIRTTKAFSSAAPRLGARRSAAAEGEHERLGRRERDACGVRLDAPELGLAALVEELRDRHSGALLDRPVEVEELPSQPPGELPAERRLARAHEADERDVAIEGVQVRGHVN